MSASVPTWGPWTTYFDPAGVAPGMKQSVSEDGLVVQFNLTGFGLAIGGREDAPLAGAAGLAGALTVDVPKDYFLAGFHLLVDDGFLMMTPHSEALFTCSIGHSSTSVELPKGYIVGPIKHAASETSRDNGLAVEGSFGPECFTGDVNTVIAGIPLPPLPITLSMQARCWGPDETVNMLVTSFTVTLLLGAIPPAPGGQGGGASNGR